MAPIVISNATQRVGEQVTLLAVSLLVIALRTYSRAKAVGIRHFKADDIIVLVAVIPIVFEHVAALLMNSPWEGLGNYVARPDADTYIPGTVEYEGRLRESKLLIAYTLNYTLIFWLMKAATLSLFSRFTHRLGDYKWRIHLGFYILGVTFAIIVLSFFLGCRPVERYWQISPNPGEYCHPGTSPVSIFVPLAFHIFESLYILSIPLPILWVAHMKLWKKLGLITLVLGNLFVVTITVVRAIEIFSSENAVEEAHCWTIRCTFVSTVATNLPLVYPMALRTLARIPCLTNLTRSSLNDDNLRELRVITIMEEGDAGEANGEQEHNRRIDDGPSPPKKDLEGTPGGIVQEIATPSSAVVK